MRRVYSDPLRRRAMREREMERIFGSSPARKGQEKDVHRTPTREGAEGGEQAAPPPQTNKGPWRPPSVRIPYEDGREYLVSQYAYYADPRKFSEVYIESSKKGAGGDGKRRGPNYNRLVELARPLSVTPRQVEEEEELNAPPPFHVDRRIRYNDEV
ncbi:hypothetical protein STCU_00283 [Strigomonas culicis]|uniref:Uncharacterized protein n=1 Tax=Strigomonas culicis TaxID=28005 RepID=S9WLZ1_9TRYP|nr:hypothetical protein STCU_00283 [Strigomonas culicis]|eukprot:EPY37015.1 hypothetical protein STCU_00283 [Strigomonas culicis]